MEREVILELIRESAGEGIRPESIAKTMGLAEKARHRLRKILEGLLDEGTVEKGPGGKYRLAGMGDGESKTDKAGGDGARAAAAPVLGRIRVHPAGYGFVERDDGEEDVFIAARWRDTALDGDRVEVTTWPGYKGTEGRVVRVLARGRAKITGTLRAGRGGFYLEPDDPRLSGPVGLPEGAASVREGQAVVAEITRYPAVQGEPLEARVLRVLGDPDDPRTEVAKVLVCADIPAEFPDDVEKAGAHAPAEVLPEDLADRVDLRDCNFITCDPETARDFDDAVCVEEQPDGGWRLWVAVADVSHYVRPGTALDREARARGCSVYLPDRAIAMLPHPLSSGICSLNPEVDRLAMVCRLDFGRDTVVQDTMFCPAVIRSRARLDYAGVAAALTGDFRGPRARYQEHMPHLERMQKLASRLRARREQRGALDFAIEQAQVVLDDDDPRRVRDVRRSKPSQEIKVAYGIVEDFMLAANEAVAHFFGVRKLDTLWRVHDRPDEARIEEFARLAAAYGIVFRPEEAGDPRVLRRVSEELAGRPASRALSFLLLRSLKQAVYDVANVGHFGLAAKEYLHFTSPIRRYPDLIVHRLLKRQLAVEGQPSGGVKGGEPPARETLAGMAAESSAHERRAMAAEREVVDMYRAWLMREHIGEEYGGVVAATTPFGLFVQLDAPFVEGLLRVQSLGDFYEYVPEEMCLRGRRSGHAFRLGDRLRVRVQNVSVPRRQIDLALAGDDSEAEKGAYAAQGAPRGRAGRTGLPRKGAPAKARGSSRRGTKRR